MTTYETTTEYQQPTTTYEPITAYEPTTTYRSPVQWEKRIESDFEQEDRPAITENVRPTDSIMSDQFKSKMEDERTETESAKPFSMDESMMDISKGETFEEQPELSQSMATETGDQGTEGGETPKEDGMKDLEPRKGEAELMAEFDSNEAKYKNFPTSPAITRR